MECGELYKTAFWLHRQYQYDEAMEKYNEVISQYPESQEAKWARTQIEKIESMPLAERAKPPEVVHPVTSGESTGRVSRPRFQTATGLGRTISLLGWLLMALSILAGIIVMATVRNIGGVLGFVILIGGCAIGLLTVVDGQLLQAVVAIENNTDKATQLLSMVVDLSKAEKTAASIAE